MSAIELAGLVKTFGSVRALDGLDLVVEPGEVHGFLGPNGSGKSTTMRVLLGLLRADAGTARMLGGDPWQDAAELHRRIAYVPGDVPLWPNLTGGEVIDVLGRLRGRGRNGLDDGLREQMLERFELDPTKKSRTYSKGNRQKVALVAAFSAEADLYLLDEPTSGLDPLMESVFQDCVEEVVARGATVLLSSHILAEVERLADRVSIIRAGRNVQSGTLSDLRTLTRTTVVAETRGPVDLTDIPGVHDVDHGSGGHDSGHGGAHGSHTVTLAVDTAQLDDVVGVLHRAGILALRAHPPTLEELFLRQYGDVVAAEPDDTDAR